MKGLHVDDGGNGGVPVVLHHGLGANLEVWRSQIDHLRRSRRVLAFDMRGHGRSPKASEYTVAAVVGDLDEITAAMPRFWLIGHSFAGVVLTEFSGRRPDRVHGLVYVDALGDSSNAPEEIRQYFRNHDAGMTPERLQEAYLEMLGPMARPETKRQVLQAVAGMDLPAFAALRASMLEVASPRQFAGPRFAIDAEGTANPRMACHLPGVKQRTVPGVSHWLMLDEPDTLNRALDEVLK
ncbi:MAG: alpha/beta hydrolase [Deltaproteobacteria bacterium]|nr:MAG: alpha/beta hydrolase [Deltaproteobacteria bacterium]